MRKPINQMGILRYGMTVGAIVVIIFHYLVPNCVIDTATLFLIGVMIIPWLSPLFKSVELPGGLKFEFNGSETLDKVAKDKADEAIKETTSSQLSAIKWDKVATLFWLGNDLMWIQDHIHKVSPPERLLQGINNSIQYAEELGFANNSLPIQNLNMAKLITQGLLGIIPSDQNGFLLEQHYRGIEQQIQTVKWYIDALATNQQPGFEKLRAF